MIFYLEVNNQVLNRALIVIVMMKRLLNNFLLIIGLKINIIIKKMNLLLNNIMKN